MNNYENVKKLITGVTKLCSTVALTLGPKGRNAVISQNGTPVITNDGVTIAKAFKLEDKIENIGCEIAKQASIQTNQIAGDGTTTALVLTKSLIENGMELLEEKVNPVALKEGMMLASEKVCELIKSMAVEVKDITCLKQVAKLSSANSEIAQLVANAYNLVGKDGIVCMQDHPFQKSSLSIKKGLQINFGLISPYFLTESNTCKFENAKILVSSTKISDISCLVGVLEYCHNNNLPLIIFAPSFSEELIKTLIVNKLNGYVNIALISASTATGEVENITADLCALSNATLVNLANINAITETLLGNIDNFESCQENSTFINAKPCLVYDKHIKDLQLQIQSEQNEFKKFKLQKRLSMLTKGIAVINVGASTDIERMELKLRIEDAIESTKNALKYGVVSGGGIAFLKCKKKLKRFINTIINPDTKMGAMLVYNCLDKPLTQLAENSGMDSLKLIKKITTNISQKPYYCFNANTNKCCSNAYISGIIDASCVPTTALTNAVSVTATLLSTVAVVC